MVARTWLVLALDGQDERTTETDESAHAAGWGIAYETGEGLPEYLGVWLAPNGGHYHVYSDYPASHHERFGFVQSSKAS